jgi:predicted metal-dependent phosphoesterase TrpH
MPNSSIDLHLHSHYSDGHASPAEIVRHAAEIGLKTISITDHDNLNGWREAQFVAEQVGIDLVSGIEFTARWDRCSAGPRSPGPGQNIDILAYFFNPRDTNLISFCDDLLDDLNARVTKCCELLRSAGYSISINDVIDENPYYPGASQLISALYRRGLAPDWEAAFEIFAHFWPQVRTTVFTIQQAIQAAHNAGGIAILAHPVIVRCNGEERLTESALETFLEAGLDGLEIYHPMLDNAARQHFLSLAKRYNLLVSGGSDEHGPSGGFSRMGCEPVTYPMLAAMQQRAQKYPKTASGVVSAKK